MKSDTDTDTDTRCASLDEVANILAQIAMAYDPLKKACIQAACSASSKEKSHLRQNLKDARQAFDNWVIATEAAAGLK